MVGILVLLSCILKWKYLSGLFLFGFTSNQHVARRMVEKSVGSFYSAVFKMLQLFLIIQVERTGVSQYLLPYFISVTEAFREKNRVCITVINFEYKII